MMMEKLKKFYLHQYQQTAYEIAVARGEYDKFGSFATITLLGITALKLFWHNLPFWVLPVLFLSITISAKWFGRWLIKLGVPKKTAELGNAQNPTLMEILSILREKK
jgi:hypothetical protein